MESLLNIGNSFSTCTFVTLARMSDSNEHPSGSGGDSSSSITLRMARDEQGRLRFVLSDGPQGDREFTLIVNTLKRKAHEILDTLGATPEERAAVMRLTFLDSWEGRTLVLPPGATGPDSDSGMDQVLANLLMRLREAPSQHGDEKPAAAEDPE